MFHEVLALLALWCPARCAKYGASDLGLWWTGAGPWYLEPLGLGRNDEHVEDG